MDITTKIIVLLLAISLVTLSVLSFMKYDRVRKTGEDISVGRERSGFEVKVSKGDYVKKSAWMYKLDGVFFAIGGLIFTLIFLFSFQ